MSHTHHVAINWRPSWY